MPETRRKFDTEFREGAVRIVRDTGKPIAQVARDLGINAGTLGNWVAKDRADHEGTEGLSRVCQEFGVTDCVGSTFGVRKGVRRR